MKKITIIVCLLLTFSRVSAQLDMNCLKETNSKVYEFVKEWIGKPYKFGGESKFGIDCSAFVQKAYKYLYNLTINRTCEYQLEQFRKISKESLSMGDLIFFKSKVSPSGWHVGLYLMDGYFIHSANRKDGVKISSLDEDVYKRIYYTGGKFNNL